MTTASFELTPGTALRDGRYAVIRKLGQGAQGETLEAIDKLTGTPVAIKRFVVRGAASWKDVELAEREARVLATLKHPNLPVYLDHFEEQGCLYLVMERIEGESLLALRRGGVAFSQQDVVRFLQNASDSLEHLHRRAPPVIHRDIKPSNVLRRPDGSFCLVDFGSVRERLQPEGGSTVVGTFGYMAPEQFQGRALPASDVYAVGATALWMLTGIEPEKLPHRGLAIDVRSALGPGFDHRWIRMLGRMLEPDPERRAGSVASLIAELGQTGPHDRHRKKRHGRKRDRAKRHRRVHAAPSLDGLLSNPFVVSAVLIALAVARLAVWAMFQVFLPTLLTLLSIVMGRGLRRVAHVLSEVGSEGRSGLRRAGALVREKSAEAVARRYAASAGERVRVESPESEDRVRVDRDVDPIGEWLPPDSKRRMRR